MKKLAIIIPTMNGGGAEKNILFLCENLKLKFCITLIVFNLEGILKDDIPNEIEIINLNRKGKYAFFKLFNYLKNTKFDIILSTIAIANLYVSIVKFFFRNKKVIIREANILSVENHGFVFNILYKYFIKYVDTIISQSEDMKNDLIKNFVVKEEKIRVINNPINMKKYIQINQRLVKSKKLKLISVGRLVNQKGYLPFIQELSTLKEVDFEYEIFGEGPLKMKIKELIEEKELKGKIFLRGYSKDVYRNIANSDYLILPSLHEGFPNVLLEALNLGIPVLANNCKGGINEIIKENENGYIFKLEKKGDFKRVLNLSLDKDWNYKKIKEDINIRYSNEVILKKYLEVL